jgi:hypothetical protein
MINNIFFMYHPSSYTKHKIDDNLTLFNAKMNVIDS